MNTKIRTMLGSLAMLATSHAQAAQWPKEPTTFMGIELGAPYENQLSKCEPSQRRPGNPCVYRTNEKMRLIANAFSFDFKYVLGMTTFENKVESFVLIVNRQNYADLRITLVERYGEPTSTGQRTVHTPGGTVPNSGTASWSGKNVTIDLFEMVDQVNESAMMIYHNVTEEAKRRSEINNLSKAAGQM